MSVKKMLAFISTHIINRAVISEYNKLSKVKDCDCILAIDNTNLKIPVDSAVTEKEFYGTKVRCFFFDQNIHNSLHLPWFTENYQTDSFSEIMWYNCDYRFYYVKKFFHDYDYYWQFEYDIFCNGNSYQSFFDKYNGTEDLLILRLRQEQVNGDWWWSKNIEWQYKESSVYGSLFPLVRLSGKAVDFLYTQRLRQSERYQKIQDRTGSNWPFCELFVPTELINNGFTAFGMEEEQITWDQEYDLNENRLFENPDGLLYHPVKGQFLERERKLKNEKALLEKKLIKLQEENRTLSKQISEDISVIIPIYNVEEYLADCLESVKRNVEGLAAEVLLIDDGSTDGSSAIAKLYAEQVQGFYYYPKENGGLSSARNYGVSLARGKYLFFVDSDDMLVDGILKKMLVIAEKRGTELTICNVARIQDGMIFGSDLHLRVFQGLRENSVHIKWYPNLVYDSTSWNKLILRSFYNKCGVSFPEGYIYEDMLPSLMLHYCCNGVSVVRETGYLWRIRTGANKQITESCDRKTLEDKIEMMAQALQFAHERVKEAQVTRALERKFLSMDFDSWLEKLQAMPETESVVYVDLIVSFINRYIHKETIEELPLIKQQIYHDLLAGNFGHLQQVILYKNKNYDRAPYLCSGSSIVMQLPANVFTMASREISHEFGANALLPACSMQSATVTGDLVTVEGYLFMQRVSVPFGTSENLKACLINENSGNILPLEIQPVQAHYLTESQGDVLNYDDYQNYRYDYDGAGFRIAVDFKDLVQKKGFMGNNYFLVSYDFSVCAGDWLLKGIKENAKRILEKFVYRSEACIGRFAFDSQNIIRIVLCDKETGEKQDEAVTVTGSPANRFESTVVERQLAQLQKDKEELEKIKNSNGFKFLTKYYKIKKWILHLKQ